MYDLIITPKVNSNYSLFKPVNNKWYTQGSILGRLLFVIYINDLKTSAIRDLVKCYLFADDAKLCKYIQTQCKLKMFSRYCYF